MAVAFFVKQTELWNIPDGQQVFFAGQPVDLEVSLSKHLILSQRAAVNSGSRRNLVKLFAKVLKLTRHQVVCRLQLELGLDFSSSMSVEDNHLVAFDVKSTLSRVSLNTQTHLLQGQSIVDYSLDSWMVGNVDKAQVDVLVVIVYSNHRRRPVWTAIQSETASGLSQVAAIKQNQKDSRRNQPQQRQQFFHFCVLAGLNESYRLKPLA